MPLSIEFECTRMYTQECLPCNVAKRAASRRAGGAGPRVDVGSRSVKHSGRTARPATLQGVSSRSWGEKNGEYRHRIFTASGLWARRV